MKPVNPRGPRLLDPFARDVFIGSLRSPLHPADDAAEDAALGDPLDAPTLIRRPVTPAPRPPSPPPPTPRFEQGKHPRIEAELSQTLVRALPAPVLRQTEAHPVAARSPSVKPADAEPAKAPPPPASRLRPLIAALMLLAVALSGARLWQRRALAHAPVATAASPSAAPRSTEATPQAPADATAASAQRSDAQPAPLPFVPAAEPGKTRQRQAVDLVARGAYAEAAALYEHLSRQTDDRVFQQAARVARRKAARSSQ